MTSTSDPQWIAEADALRARSPRHVLFLCVANSARSQLAEGIARSLAPEGVRISSAGSVPWIVHPHAIRVLEEIGIDASGQRSKSVDDVDDGTIDAAVTLCDDDDTCPVVPRGAFHLHWPLPDPTFVRGGEEEALEAFRATRDEIRRRLERLFGRG